MASLYSEEQHLHYYTCDGCGWTVSYEQPQEEYEKSFLCGDCEAAKNEHSK